jgi:hypothetical protein
MQSTATEVVSGRKGFDKDSLERGNGTYIYIHYIVSDTQRIRVTAEAARGQNSYTPVHIDSLCCSSGAGFGGIAMKHLEEYKRIV